jgi:phosphohistidine phosphatase
MKLYIVRHAIAVARGTPGIKDEDRPLTKEGIHKMRRAAAGLSALDCIPELLLSSPLLRARQTAEILLKVFGKGIELEIAPALAPSGSRQDLYRDIGLHEEKLKSLMLVGHQPSLGEIAGEIIFGSPESYIELKKGGACVIELESVRGIPKGSLTALLTPSVLRKIIV